MAVVATHADAIRIELSSVEIQHLVPIGAIPGTFIRAAAARNGEGAGDLRSEFDGTLLSWRAPGSSSFGDRIPVPTDGQYLIEDGDDRNKFVRVEVFVSFLQASPASARVYTKDVYNAVGKDDVTAAEATAGSVETYILDIANDGAMDALAFKAWIDPAVSDIEISKDGVSWFTPTSEAHVDVLVYDRIETLTTDPIHIRRTIAAAAPSAPKVLNLFHFAWDGH